MGLLLVTFPSHLSERCMVGHGLRLHGGVRRQNWKVGAALFGVGGALFGIGGVGGRGVGMLAIPAGGPFG